ncbi:MULTISPECIES: alpha/beta hydrolase [unclassified Streptomyces]|uniref:alpha/beta hydrolase n=1 Tax=unclassified Streptomyces TaxID=2593676 RepID=UPI0036E73FBD
MSGFHPDLLAARGLPRVPVTAQEIAALQAGEPVGLPAPPDVAIDDIDAPGAWGAPSVRLRVYRPRPSAPGRRPALYWMHGGGYLSGSPESDDAAMIGLVRTLGLVAVSVRYRLAPRHPAPAAVEDAYSGLAWTWAHAAGLGIDEQRIAIGGGSAGAGLTASLSHLVRDRGEYAPVFQLLIEPMLDDRTAIRTDLDTEFVRGWEAPSNRFAWTAYLGQEPGLPEVPAYAVPGRRADLSGLPPAWIGVGTLDLFVDEDLDYARRLSAAGVPCETLVVPGAFHGFESIYPDAPVSREFLAAAARALGAGLGIVGAS